MSNKCDVLREARNQVAEKGRIRNHYFDGECYCAVGYVLKALGLTDDELRELETSQINSIFYYGEYRPYKSDVFTKVYQSVNDAGITLGWLNQLQKANDESENNDEFVLTIFDEILVEANCQ